METDFLQKPTKMYCEQKNETIIHCVCVCVFVSFFITSKSHMIWDRKNFVGHSSDTLHNFKVSDWVSYCCDYH